MKNLLLTIVLCLAVIFAPVISIAGDTRAEIEEFAKKDMDKLREGIINVDEFCAQPWYKRHAGKLLAAGAVVAVCGITFVTGGLGAAPAAAGASHFVSAAGIAGGLGAGETIAVATAAAGLYIDSKGNIIIPENKRQAVYEYYRDNYNTWVLLSSSKKEFGELALKQIIEYMKSH